MHLYSYFLVGSLVPTIQKTNLPHVISAEHPLSSTKIIQYEVVVEILITLTFLDL